MNSEAQTSLRIVLNHYVMVVGPGTVEVDGPDPTVAGAIGECFMCFRQTEHGRRILSQIVSEPDAERRLALFDHLATLLGVPAAE